MKAITFLLAALLIVGEALALTNQQALDKANAYISLERKGDVVVRLPGLGAGQQVQVKQVGLDWHYGAAIHAASHLNSSTYVAKFQENFNTVSTGGPGYWLENEATRDVVTLGGLQQVVNFARDNGMYLRGHNLIYERDQPGWVKQLSNTAMREEITERINYYAPLGFDDLDVYNESFQGGELGGSGTYWNRLGRSGIAGIYNETEAKHPETRMFVNDYAALQGDHVRFAQHIDQLRAAGATVEGIGLEYYSSGADANIPANYWNAFETMTARGLPMYVSEWGQFDTASTSSLRQALTMAFGHEGVEGFLMWDWTNKQEWSFADASVLYKESSGGGLTITEMGKAWQDQLGIKDWDGNPNNGWRTEAVVQSEAGRFSFNGYWGSYEITVEGETYSLDIKKGQTEYLIGTLLPGDFNYDGVVDAADYTTWRDTDGSPAGYLLWRENYGLAGLASVSGMGVGGAGPTDGTYEALGIPEPSPTSLIPIGLALLVILPFSRSMASYTSLR